MKLTVSVSKVEQNRDFGGMGSFQAVNLRPSFQRGIIEPTNLADDLGLLRLIKIGTSVVFCTLRF